MTVACERADYMQPQIVYPCTPLTYKQMDCEFYRVNSSIGEIGDNCVYRFEGRCCLSAAREEAELQHKLEEV